MKKSCSLEMPVTLTCYGIWEVTLRSLDNYWQLQATDNLGVYEGYVDDIALTLRLGQRESETLYFENVGHKEHPAGVSIQGIPDNPEPVAIEVISGQYYLGSSTPDIRAFFKGRPVYSAHTTWGDCGLLISTATPEGMHRQQEVDVIESIVRKLSSDELCILARHGFKRYPESDFIKDYPTGEN